jgi:predicted nucleic acid-binding protein
MRDAIHAATALASQASVLVSPDRALDDVPGIERLEPAEALARLTA